MTAPLRYPPYGRLPAFVPVPVRARADGWTPLRQAEFIGWLAQTGRVGLAARQVGCSRESAYRLRRRAGAESFAHAWDAALALRRGDEVAARKVTRAELLQQLVVGQLLVRMQRGRFLAAVQKPCSSALLRLLAGFNRSRGHPR